MKIFRIRFDKNWPAGGMMLRIFKWHKVIWRNWEGKRFLMIDIFSVEKLDPKHLISNHLEDTDDYGRLLPEEEREDIGIGMSFPWKGKQGKMAVRLKRDFGLPDFRKAWNLLAEAEADPENPKYKVVWGNGRLSGNEMEID